MIDKRCPIWLLSGAAIRNVAQKIFGPLFCWSENAKGGGPKSSFGWSDERCCQLGRLGSLLDLSHRRIGAAGMLTKLAPCDTVRQAKWMETLCDGEVPKVIT